MPELIARQPIVSSDRNRIGYELLFRRIAEDGIVASDIEDGMLATAKVAVNSLNNIGMHALVGDGYAFVKINRALLLDDMILAMPKDRFVFALMQEILMNEEVAVRLEALRGMGLRFALDNADVTDAYIAGVKPVLPYISFIKVDTNRLDRAQAEAYIQAIQPYSGTLIATKVETYDCYEQYGALGCELFQGYFFAQPDIVAGKALDASFKRLFKLINLLGKDAAVEEIALEFESCPEITLQLLKFMNSGQLPLRKKINSIIHAITLLGKETLKNWLLLMAYANASDGESNFDSPLLGLAHARSRLMMEVMKYLTHDQCEAHQAALVGTLSLIDVITKTTMETVLSELDLADAIIDALLKRTGVLGELLTLAVAMEEFDFETVNRLIEKQHIAHDAFQNILTHSYQ